jgi:hypothetical protein
LRVVLKISVSANDGERRLVVEGKLVGPWVSELRTACDKAREDVQNDKLIIHLKNLTAISAEAETVLVELMNERATVRASGVFAKEVLKQLARRKNEERP